LIKNWFESVFSNEIRPLAYLAINVWVMVAALGLMSYLLSMIIR